MSFVAPEFLAFLLVVFTAYWLLGERRRQNALLAVTSVVFYGWVHPWFVLLLLGSALLDYVAAQRIAADRARGTRWLVLSVAGNIGVLGFFKYFDFFLGSFTAALEGVGFAVHAPTLRLFLPIGLSFYTFQTLGYTIDVWRGKLEARRDPLDFLVFVAYFPQLVAGPVERAENILPQIENPRVFRSEDVTSGLALALWGAFKKIVLADTLAPYVDMMYAHPAPSGPMFWAGTLGFTVQVLADFSGYTDIARGTSRMLGIHLMKNFDHPYLSATPMEFWRRWHISFSTWLRDYVYLPCSFSPWVRRWLTIPGTEPWGPFAHSHRALYVTMLASGVWHGSTWNFVLWGAWHATAAMVYAAALQRIPKRMKRQRGWRALTVPLMFAVTVVGMGIFREPSVARLLHHFGQNPLAATTDEWILSGVVVAMTAAAALPLVLALLAERYALPRLAPTPWRLPVATTVGTAGALAIFLFFRDSAGDFIYFQF